MRMADRVVMRVVGKQNSAFSMKTVLVVLPFLLTIAASAQTRKTFTYQLPPGGSVVIENQSGPVTVRSSGGRQVVVNATLHSDKVEIEPDQTSNRVQLRTHLLQQRLAGDDARVDYEVSVPADVSLSIRSVNGPILVERSLSDINIEGDTASVDVHDVSNGHVHVRTLSGPIKLANVSNGHVEIASVSGPVDLRRVSGPSVEVNTTNGKITFEGDCAGDGNYVMTSHNGDIDVTLPATASVDIRARSLKGNVQNDFPFKPKQHSAPQATAGRAYAGTSNSGGSSLQLRSFSGTIRVKKL
jgi:DUF4097 and DUF4098 domain-containing protein YvlB